MTSSTSLHHVEAGAASGRGTGRPFLSVVTLLFAACAALTIVWCAPGMEEMPMPGGWTMSMIWMRMPGQSWSAAAASFLISWTVMMTAMMLPSLIPTLLAVRRSPGRLTALAGVGYLMVWALLGLAIYPAGVAMAGVEMRSPALAGAVPMARGIVVLLAGAFQFSSWKAHHLACCREAPGLGGLPRDAAAAWRLGVRLGLHCCCECAGLTAILLVLGMMDLRVMAVIATAITAERIAPAGERVARATGVVAAGIGLVLMEHAARLALFS